MKYFKGCVLNFKKGKYVIVVPATCHCLTLVTGKSNGLRFSNLVLEKSIDIRIPSMSLTTCLTVCKAQTDPSHIAFILEDRCICAKGKLIYNDYKLELVSKELNHFGVIAGLFWQIGGHSSRFVLFCFFKTFHYKSVNYFHFLFEK